MAKKNNQSNEYLKHQHKIMILIGLLIIVVTYNADSHLGVIFGSLIVGAGIARVKDS